RNDLLAERLNIGADASVRGRIRRGGPSRHGVEVALRALPRHTRLEPAKHQYARPAAELEVTLIGVIADRHPHVRCSERGGHIRPRYADDGEGKSIEYERPSDHVRPRTETRAPDVVRDHGHRLLRRDLGLLWRKEPSLRWRRAEH